MMDADYPKTMQHNTTPTHLVPPRHVGPKRNELAAYSVSLDKTYWCDALELVRCKKGGVVLSP